MMKYRNTLLVCILIVFSGWTGYWFGTQRLKMSFINWKPAIVVNKSSNLTGVPSEADFSMFWVVWDKVSQLYVDKSQLDPKKMVDGAILGMVAAIGDPYTAYLPVQQNKESKEDLGGAFEGVGIQLGYKDKQLAVMAPLEGTPAYQAGVQAGDLILKIMDKAAGIEQTTDGIAIPQAVKLIRGAKGTKVTLTLYREGKDKPFDVELSRDTIIVKSVTLKWVENKAGKKVAWLKLTRFGDLTQSEWLEAVNNINIQCLNSGDVCAGMVLDVRNNPGGYLETAVYLAGEFLKAGKLVVSQQYGDGTKTENNVDRNGRLLDIPLVSLVNGGSASASEILVGALQDHKRSKVVGVQSFGKGSVQQPEDFPDGSGVHVTVARWLRPSGEWLDKKGVTPDDVVTWDGVGSTDDYKQDPQLMRAMEIL
jgi:carboxyl-terminal processing protease